MNLIWQGIGLGLVLSILIGPLLFALIQAAIVRGFRAGAMVGLGIWFSDLLFILLTYWSVGYVARAIANPNFELLLGFLGGGLLMCIGWGTILIKPPNYEKIAAESRLKSYPRLFLKGFAINTFNPFTVAFWTGLMSTILLKNGFDQAECSIFLASIMLTIILADLAKVLLAKKIRTYLKPAYILSMRKISGAALVLFGVAMIIRVIVT